MTGGQEVVGSNPAVPTRNSPNLLFYKPSPPFGTLKSDDLEAKSGRATHYCRKFRIVLLGPEKRSRRSPEPPQKEGFRHRSGSI